MKGKLVTLFVYVYVCVLASLPWYVIMVFSSHTHHVPLVSLYYYSWISVRFVTSTISLVHVRFFSWDDIWRSTNQWSNLYVVVRGASELYFPLILMNSSIKPSRHTWRQNNVVSTSMRRHDVVNGLWCWCIDVDMNLFKGCLRAGYRRMIWTNVVRPTSPKILYTLTQTLWSFGSGEANFCRVLPYISMWGHFGHVT